MSARLGGTCFAVFIVALGGLSMAQEAGDVVQSEQYGAVRRDFSVVASVGEGKGFILLPIKETTDGSKPWVWYAPTLIGQHPDESHEWMFRQLLENGFSVCGVDVGESYGNPKGRQIYTELYRLVVAEYGLAPKACLLAQSRGGLMLYNWAAENSAHVQCVAGIYTVCNLTSWPGLAVASPAYGMEEGDLRACLAQHNPIDRLKPLAKAGIPILHVHGDADRVVPIEQNSGELVRRYKALGGCADVLVVPGKGHEVCDEFFKCEPIVAFLLHQGALIGEREAPETQEAEPSSENQEIIDE